MKRFLIISLVFGLGIANAATALVNLKGGIEGLEYIFFPWQVINFILCVVFIVNAFSEDFKSDNENDKLFRESVSKMARPKDWHTITRNKVDE